MKGWIIKDGKLIFDQNLRRPKIKKGWAIVKNITASLCGSDIGIINKKIDVFKEGVALGHEFAGIIENYDRNWKENIKIEIEQRVAVNPYVPCYKCFLCQRGRINLCKDMKIIGAHYHGGFGEYAAAPIENLIPIDDLLFKYACLIQPVACALSAVSKINNSTFLGRKKITYWDGLEKKTIGSDIPIIETLENKKILVLGGGPMGLLIGFIAKENGAKIFLAEKNYKRRTNYGPLITDKGNLFDANSPELEKNILDKTGGGADIVVDAVGCLLRNGYKYVKENGIILLFGLNKEAELNQYKLTREETNKIICPSHYPSANSIIEIKKKVRFIGSYLALPIFFDKALEWIKIPEHQKFLDALTYEKISLDILPRAINFMEDGKAVKMIIYPQENVKSFSEKLKNGTLEK